ncbi:MAG: HAD family hydrolase [Muribaculaceae bacterium]|nr:HAD family hydrolase [Muribaculaceae bacterium]
MNIDITKVKGIIFDYGGTLDTAGEHWSEVIWEAYRQSAVIVDKAEFREAYVYAERELARERHILPAHDFNDLLQIKMKIELEYLAEKGLFPPAQVDDRAKMIADICYRQAKETVASTIPVLESLSQKYPMVLVSNFYGNIETVLEDFGIRKYFKAIIESAVMGVRKPDPRIFEHGVKALGVLPGETLVIGDSYRKDILPAESIGCQVLWLKGKGWTEEEDAQLHPNIISSLGEILNIVVG